MVDEAKAYAPASIGNIGPGFDVLGVAIEEPGDIVIAKRVAKPGVELTICETIQPLPNAGENLVVKVAQSLLAEYAPQLGLSLKLYKRMPIGSGLGSSGASAAAAAMAVNALLPNPLPKKELIRFAMEGERLASGSAHADNVAPSLLGGMCLIRSYDPLDIIQLPIAGDKLWWVVAHPQMVIPTQMAREILPQTIPLNIAISQWGNLAALVTALVTNNIDKVRDALKDAFAEPIRAKLIPGFEAVREGVFKAGALGFSISGSGPSVFALTTSRSQAKKISQIMTNLFLAEASLPCQTYVSQTNMQGARLIENLS